MREAPRKHFRPRFDRRALLSAEALELLLEQPFHAFLGGLAIALLQRAEQRAVVALGEPVMQLRERLVDLLARGRRLEQPRGAIVLGVPHDLVHADPRDRELRADLGRDIGRHGHVDDQRRLARRRPRREPLERGFVENRVLGAGRREQRFERWRRAPKLVERRVLRAEARASAAALSALRFTIV